MNKTVAPLSVQDISNTMNAALGRARARLGRGYGESRIDSIMLNEVIRERITANDTPPGGKGSLSVWYISINGNKVDVGGGRIIHGVNEPSIVSGEGLVGNGFNYVSLEYNYDTKQGKVFVSPQYPVSEPPNIFRCAIYTVFGTNSSVTVQKQHQFGDIIIPGYS